MERREREAKVYPTYVLSGKEFKDKLGITEPGSVLTVSVNYYEDQVTVTLYPLDGRTS